MPTVETSPRLWATMAGIFELLEGFTAAFGQVVILGRLVVLGDAAATAANILGHQPLFWVGFASSLAGVAFHLTWVLLIYDLFRPVNKSLALLAVLFGLVTCAMQALTGFLYLAPLIVLQSSSAASAITPGQLQALAMVFLRLNGYAFDVDLVFFGFWCILTGYLIFRSTFLPRILGLLLMIDGVGWALYLVPPLASYLFPVIAAASAIAEIPLPIWLIARGVNVARWKEQAGHMVPEGRLT